jgi:hypothetical protein
MERITSTYTNQYATGFNVKWAGRVKMGKEYKIMFGKLECRVRFIDLDVEGRIRWIRRIKVFGCKLDPSTTGH